MTNWFFPTCKHSSQLSYLNLSNFIVNFKGETYKTIHSFHNFPTRNQLCKAIVKDENFGGILQSFHRLGLASHQGKDDTFHLDLQDLHRFVSKMFVERWDYLLTIMIGSLYFSKFRVGKFLEEHLLYISFLLISSWLTDRVENIHWMTF